MARKTVANLRDSISGLLSGLNLANVVNLNTVIERSAREMAQLIAIPEAVASTAITLYDGVFDYLAPTDSYGSQFVDIRPQGISRNLNDFSYHATLQDFDRTKGYSTTGYKISWEYVKGVGRLRIVSNVPVPHIELDPMTATTGWTAAGSASSLALDSTVFYQSPGALRLTLTGNSVGTLTKTTASVDLTGYTGVGVVFLAMRTPSITNLTSIAIRIGSDASNYYEVSNTTGFLGTWVTNDWILTAFDLSTATTTGTPVITAIDYSQVRITHSGTITNFYVGDLFISLPSPTNFLYPVDAIFQTSGGNPSQSITNTGDTVLLNDDALLIYEYICAINIAQQQGGSMSSGAVSEISSKLNGARARNGRVIQIGLLDLYRARNPIQDIPAITNYYDAW